MIGAVFLFGAGEYIQYINVETISMKDALADYDYIWKVLEGNYPFLKMAERKTGLSMDALKMTYRDKIEAEAGKQPDFYDDFMQWRFQFFHDPSVSKRYDYLARKYSADKIAQNEESTSNLSFQEIGTDIAYVKINSFAIGNMSGDKDILDKWLSENAHKKNIIIDITGNGGGGNVFHVKLPKSSLIMKYRAIHGLNPDGSSNVEFGTTPDVVYSGLRGANEVSFLGICLDYIKSID